MRFQRLQLAWHLLRGRSVCFRTVFVPQDDGRIAMACYADTGSLQVSDCGFIGFEPVGGQYSLTFEEAKNRTTDWIRDPENGNRWEPDTLSS